MKIKIAENADFPALARLRWNFKLEDGVQPRSSQKDFEDKFVFQLKSDSKLWTHFLAQEGQDILGMVSICRIPKLLSPELMCDSIGYLTNSYVIPARRNLGIGERLLRFAVDWGKKNNLELLFVWPSDQSRPLYSRIGFKEENEIMELLFS